MTVHCPADYCCAREFFFVVSMFQWKNIPFKAERGLLRRFENSLDGCLNPGGQQSPGDTHADSKGRDHKA